ncbi:hypothetical protein KY285_021518 [Solanum tuberosum]|nr:hypothetical protein KY289_021791 [Solanum tuberosum]KAH0694421.1 hypothetical protein KY285_021518 [Solanum tuberosum]
MNDSSNFIRIEMKQWFENLAMTIIIRMLYGKEHNFEEGKRARNEDMRRKWRRMLRKDIIFLKNG